MKIRLADSDDIKQLVRMRWDFTIEHDESKKDESYIDFEKECQYFLEKAVRGDQWYIWVVEDNGKVVSHIYIELIQKVPRPGRITYPFAYMTNVYTIPTYRNQGIGSRLLAKVNEWIKEKKFEFVIVWPSDDAVGFYEKNGYVRSTGPMEYFPS